MDDLFDEDILKPAPEADGMVILSVANAYKKQYYLNPKFREVAGDDTGGASDHVRAVHGRCGRNPDTPL